MLHFIVYLRPKGPIYVLCKVLDEACFIAAETFTIGTRNAPWDGLWSTGESYDLVFDVSDFVLEDQRGPCELLLRYLKFWEDFKSENSVLSDGHSVDEMFFEKGL